MDRTSVLVVLGLCFATQATADLIDNGDGTVTDTSTGLMWLQNPKLAGAPTSWSEAMAWAENLDFAGYTDWRLPNGGFVSGFCVEGGTLSNGGCNMGYYISRPSAQLASLYLTTLGNQPYCAYDDPTTTLPVCDESDKNPSWTNPSNRGPFDDVNGSFWTNTGLGSTIATYFDMATGFQGFTAPQLAYAYAWAVRGAQPEANLSITKANDVTSIRPGDTVTYTISVSNSGPDAAPMSYVADLMPSGLTGVTWTCVGWGGATCPASGAGNITNTVDLPAGAGLTYSVVATVAQASGMLVNTATVTAPPAIVDPEPFNNLAMDEDTISGGGPTPPPKPIPTLSDWGMMVLASAMAIFGLTLVRRRKLRQV